MKQYLVYTIKTYQVVDSEDPEEIKEIFEKLREFGSVEDYDVSVVEVDGTESDALDKFRGK